MARFARRHPHSPDLPLLAETCPDLPRALLDLGAPSSLVGDVSAFGRWLRNNGGLTVDTCLLEDDTGAFHVGVHRLSLCRSVEAGDEFFGGALLTGNAHDGTVCIAPRILRRLCTNGTTITTYEAGDVAVYRRDAQGLVHGNVSSALEAAQSGHILDASVARMRLLLDQPAHDAVATLAALGADIPIASAPAIQRVFEAARVRTAYGALNALTQTARDAATLAERERLEEEAGGLVLAPVERPVF